MHHGIQRILTMMRIAFGEYFGDLLDDGLDNL